MKRVWILAGAVMALTACGGKGTGGASSTSPADPIATSTASVSPAPTSSSPSVKRKKPATAADFIAAFKAAKLPIKVTIVYTAANDRNHLLGRPNGYLAKNAWSDRRVPKSAVDGQDFDALERGGSIETFSTAAGAQARKNYIQSILKSAPALGTEYDYVVGSNLIRLSGILTPTQAKDYPDAVK